MIFSNYMPLLARQGRHIFGRRLLSSGGIPKEPEIRERVRKVMSLFDKIDKSKISDTAKFTELGLDSLDQVELVIAFEEEFKMELTDDVAEQINTPNEAVHAIEKAFLARL